MTTEEFGTILDRLGWGAYRLAEFSGRDPRNMRRMIAGQIPVDDAMATWITEMDRAWRPVQALIDRPPRTAWRGDP